MTDQRDHEEHKENEEQQFGDAGSRHRDTRKTQNTRDNRHDQKHDCPVKHLPSFEPAHQIYLLPEPLPIPYTLYLSTGIAVIIGCFWRRELVPITCSDNRHRLR
jgi:hypothetical protein